MTVTDNASEASSTPWLRRAGLLVFLLACLSIFSSSHAFAEPADTDNDVSYEVLAAALANDEVRDKLVEELRTLAADDPDAIAELPATEVEQAPKQVKPNPIILRLQSFAHNLRADLVQAWYSLKSLGSGDSSPIAQFKFWQNALFNLLITTIAVVAGFLLFRRLAHPVFKYLDRWARRQPTQAQLSAIQKQQNKRNRERKKLADEAKKEQAQAEAAAAAQTEAASSEFAHLQTEEKVSPPPPEQATIDTRETVHNYATRFIKLRKLVAVVVAFAIDVFVIVAASLVGYLAILALPNANVPTATLLSMHFLTAFFAIEVVKALSRGVFSTRYEQLRLIAISDESATYWNRWVATIVTAGGYGLMVAVPAVYRVFSPSLANVLGAILILLVYIYAVRVLWQNRQSVSDALLTKAERTTNAFMGTVLRMGARLWLWVALLYFTVLFVVTQADQQNALGFMANASAQTVIAVVIGGLASLLLSSMVTQRIYLPAHLNQSFPLLEVRLNSYIPAGLKILRLFVVIGVLLSIFDAWHVLDLRSWLSSERGLAVLNTIIRVGVILVVAALSWTLLASMIEHRLATSGERMPTEREKTLLLLFRNALAIIIITMTILIVLSQVGIDIGPLIAGAGVIGLAIGFGAQKLVQDVITGVFIQLENGMNQNDVVEVAGLFGVVEKLTIRSVVIRTLDGGYHLVPFSSIDCVANHTRDYGYHYGEYCIGLRESVDDAIRHLYMAFEDTKRDPEVANDILEDISIPGVSSIHREGFNIRVLIKTTPGMQWAVQRSFNRFVKMHFDAAGIELPYPQTVLHFGRDKNGYAAPADLRMVEPLAEGAARPSQDTIVAAPGQTLRTFPDDPQAK